MKNTAIIIPTRLGAKRFPNKPLAKINDIPMIIHVLNRAKESKIGEVIVATPDNEICEIERAGSDVFEGDRSTACCSRTAAASRDLAHSDYVGTRFTYFEVR